MVLITRSHSILSTGPLINLHSECIAGDFRAIKKTQTPTETKKHTHNHLVFKYQLIHTSEKQDKYFKVVFNLIFLSIWGKKCNSCGCHKAVTHPRGTYNSQCQFLTQSGSRRQLGRLPLATRTASFHYEGAHAALSSEIRPRKVFITGGTACVPRSSSACFTGTVKYRFLCS